MHGRWSLWITVLCLGSLLSAGCASEGTTNVWGQRWNIPYEGNTVGAELGVWPKKELDIYVQWVTPRLLEERLLQVAEEANRRRLDALLGKYTVVRVVAKNHKTGWSPFFEYDRWSLLVGGKEHRAVVPSGANPNSEGGYFVGHVPAGGSLAGWVFFPPVAPGPEAVNIIYDFGYQRTTFSFPPLLRR